MRILKIKVGGKIAIRVRSLQRHETFQHKGTKNHIKILISRHAHKKATKILLDRPKNKYHSLKFFQIPRPICRGWGTARNIPKPIHGRECGGHDSSQITEEGSWTYYSLLSLTSERWMVQVEEKNGSGFRGFKKPSEKMESLASKI